MLKSQMQDALNKQINAELHSSYIYLAMAAYCAQAGLMGMAHWLKLQAKEEVGHAMKIFQYVIDRGGNVALSKIDVPKGSWASPLDVFEAAYKHECYVSSLIDGLVADARTHNDIATENFLQWFVAEQVEEEASAQEVVDKLELATNGAALLVIDQWMASRS
ncbi:ferritin [Candidatus Babeliales bacterium]|nr:ferritin [Candidatus Babeliales bacterium]